MINNVRHQSGIRLSIHGFSLVEVVIALALIAIAIPSLVGTLGYFSEVSVETRDRDDTQPVVAAIQLYLENEAVKKSGSKAEIFTKVYDWVAKARATPDVTTVLFVYNQRDGTLIYNVSDKEPDTDELSALDGRIMAVEIHAPARTLLSDDELSGGAQKYQKAWLPYLLKIYAVASGDEPRTKVNFVDSVPVILSR